MGAEVIVISNSIVRPESYSEESDRVKIHLTPWDLFFLRAEYPQRGLLFPQPDPETRIISQLKSSLSVALKIFYPFAGRLVKIKNEDDGTASFYVDCDGSGVKFIHASAKSVSVSDVLEPVDGNVPEFLNRFYPANGVTSYEGISDSLIAFQVTELKDGVFIGFGYNHMVADGSSFWSFFNTWSEICFNGFDSDHRRKFPPLLLRGWFLDGIEYPIRIPMSETETPNRVVVTSSLIQEKIFRVTSRNISELKAKANGEVSSDDRKISSLQGVSAFMWRSIIRNSGLNPEEVIHCKLLVDMRRRLNPPLEKECFGNVVGFATVTTTVAEMLNNGLGWAALQINKTVGSQTNEEFREFAENWVKKPSILNAKAFSNCITIASSPRFNVYGNDFGWGKPIAVRAGPGNTTNGKLIAYPGIEEEAAIDRLPLDLLAYIFSLVTSFTVLGQASGVCKKWRKAVNQSMARRESLSFAGWKMDDDSTSRLVHLAYNLKELDISRSRWGCHITDNGLYQIASARCVSNLNSVSLWGMTAITDSGVVQLISRTSSLQHLNIGGTFITDESLFAIAERCHHLKTIGMWCCRHVTERGLLVLVNKCRKLESINLWGTRVPVDCFIALLTISPALQIKPMELLLNAQNPPPLLHAV
ncbi:unnamed protein product [Arabidopsis arenosa]|uniref:F-box domain-containing protein n=1 Tax=Arabidopsis arenosa TaxID=38785 RepID=A0A8S2BAN5_ARAAE|nr:unnamed protein product [Arabidopsis arenosa]